MRTRIVTVHHEITRDLTRDREHDGGEWVTARLRGLQQPCFSLRGPRTCFIVKRPSPEYGAMRLPPRRLRSFAAVLLLAVLAASCGGDTPSSLTPTVPPVASIELSRSWINLQTGRFFYIAATLRDRDGSVLTGRPIAWSSSTPGVASVSAGGGTITGEYPGLATITATVESKVAFVEVHVQSTPVVDCDSTAHLGCGFAPEQFVRIPPGSFRMGSDRYTLYERPAHDVTVSRAFLLQRTEVTQSQWQAVMGRNPSYWFKCGDTCPVEKIGWDDIQLFIQRLNAANAGARFRLPTEAEWEYAARAGSPEDRYGPLDSIAQQGNRTHPAAEKQPNAFGLYDMLGNVTEMVSDIFGPYEATAVVDPTGPATVGPFGRVCTARGAGAANWWEARASYREGRTCQVDPRYYNEVGFRLARDP